MSKINQLIWTFCVISSVLSLYYYSPYLAVSIVLIAVIIYLYIDYENHQPQTASHRRWNTGLELGLHAGLISNFWTSSKEVVKNLTRNLYRPLSTNLNRPIMPSVNSYTVKAGPSIRPLSGYFATPNLNRDENKLSPRLRHVSRAKPIQSPGLDGFHALSPIRRDSSNTSEEFNLNRLSINEFESPQRIGLGLPLPRPSPGYISNTSYNIRPAMNSSRNSSTIQKRSTPSSASKNVQTFAGPLLASTRYNLSSESALFADANSPGLSSRVAKYSQDSADRSRSATHQSQYSGPGQFPTVHLGKTSRLPVLSSRNSQKLARVPVRLRMAPPEPEDRRLYVASDRSSQVGSPPPRRTVLDTLHELSRKRLHATLGEDDGDGGTKKLRRDEATQKRTREESPDGEREDPEDRLRKRTRSNEIQSSLSSSRYMGVKRKTMADTSGSGVTMPADKVQRKSAPSPVAAPPPAAPAMETEAAPAAPAAAQVAPQPPGAQSPMSVVVPSEEATVDVRDSLEYLPPQKEDGREWLRRGFMPGASSVALRNIQTKRQEDTKQRLKTMMSAIGGNASSSLQSAAPEVVSPSVSTATLSTPAAAPASNLKSPFTLTFPEKHVHFAENLTQVKTFDVPAPDSDASENLLRSRTVPGHKRFPATGAQPAALPFGPAVTSVAEVAGETEAAPVVSGAPSLSDDGAGFKLPTTPGAGFALPGYDVARLGAAASGFGGLGSDAAPTVSQPSAGFSPAVPASLAPAFTLAASSPSTLGKPSAPDAAPGGVTFSSPSTFGQLGAAATLPVMSSGFGKSVPSPVATFGQVTTVAATAPAATFSPAMTFGIGTLTSTAGLFGQTATTAPLTTFGSAEMSGASAFGVPAVSKSLPSQEGGFGALAPASAKAAEPPKLFGFGATTTPQTQASAFGVLPTTTVQSGFDGFQQPSVFGAKAASGGGFSFPSGPVSTTAVPATQTAAPPSYGSAVKTSTFQFNAPAAPGAPQTSKPTAPVFGAPAAGPSTNGPSSTSGGFSFGSTASKPFAFGSTTSSGPTPISSVSSQNPFASQAQQGGVNASNLTQVQIQPAPASSLFSFGGGVAAAPAQPQAGAFSFGGAAPPKPGGFSFGATSQPSSAGGFGFGTAAPQQAPTFGQASQPSAFGQAAQPSAFGQTMQPASAFGQATPSFGLSARPTSAFGQTAQSTSAFGQTMQPTPSFGQASQSTPAFGQASQSTPTFGQASQSTPAFGQASQSTPTFGQASQPTPTFGQASQSTPTFGQASQSTPAFGQPSQSTPTFGQASQSTTSFGQSATPATGGFQFGAAPAGTGGFNFGSSTATPTFGAGMPANMFQMGGATASPAPGMFSIGTGTTAPRGRPGPRSRRR